jgi:hypothetical protein
VRHCRDPQIPGDQRDGCGHPQGVAVEHPGSFRPSPWRWSPRAPRRPWRSSRRCPPRAPGPLRPPGFPGQASTTAARAAPRGTPGRRAASSRATAFLAVARPAAREARADGPAACSGSAGRACLSLASHARAPRCLARWCLARWCLARWCLAHGCLARRAGAPGPLGLLRPLGLLLRLRRPGNGRLRRAGGNHADLRREFVRASARDRDGAGDGDGSVNGDRARAGAGERAGAPRRGSGRNMTQRPGELPNHPQARRHVQFVLLGQGGRG